MSRENVEVVSRSFDAFREGRIAEWIDTLDVDVEWDISAHPLPDFPNVGRGREALAQHMLAYLSGWNGYEAWTKELIDRADDVVLIAHERARMRDSDVSLDRDLAMVWTIRDGLGVGLRVFKTRAEALEAAQPLE